MKKHVEQVARDLGIFEKGRSLVEHVRLIRGLLGKKPYPLHRNEPIAPFFIVGSGRCGTTLLRRVLQASPEVHIPPENWTLRGVIHRFRKYRWGVRWEDFMHLMTSRLAHQGEEREPRWFDFQQTDALLEKLAQVSAEKRSLAHAIDLTYRYHGRVLEDEFERWGDKTPVNATWVRPILRVFPNARFVHLIRDPFDVVASFLRLGRYPEPSQPALHWKSRTSTVRAFMHDYPHRCLEVHYERFVQKPEATVRAVCDFLGISFSQQLLSERDQSDQMTAAASSFYHENVFDAISDEHIGKGRRQLGADQTSIVQETIGEEQIRRFGYDSV
jgi:hypothetical protein